MILFFTCRNKKHNMSSFQDINKFQFDYVTGDVIIKTDCSTWS